jgi:hypothetical protein
MSLRRVYSLVISLHIVLRDIVIMRGDHGRYGPDVSQL